jgi:TolB protein
MRNVLPGCLLAVWAMLPAASPVRAAADCPHAIVFYSGRGGNKDIYLLREGAREPRRLTDHPAADLCPAPSPDGKRIAFLSDRGGNMDIYSMDLEGNDLRRLTSTPEKEEHPEFTPDGRRILFVRDLETRTEIWIMNADGTHPRRLTSNDARDERPFPSPDGSRILFMSNRDGNYEIYTMAADGSGQTRLTHTPEWEIFPTWSPDGGEIAYASKFRGAQGRMLGMIRVMNADGRNDRALTAVATRDENAMWSPDGRFIVFQSVRDGNFEVYRMGRDGGDPVRLTDDPAWDGWAAFVPAGGGPAAGEIAFATFVSAPEQERAVAALVRSLRERGGRWSGGRVFVVTGDPVNLPCGSLRGEGVEILPLEMDPAFRGYPLALKAFAAAQVESLVRERAATLIWLDPGVLVLAPPADLVMGAGADVTVRPVTLANTIGLPPGSEPNEYWRPIYAACGLDYRALPALTTIADGVPVQPYYNCEAFSFSPRLGLAAEWARLLTRLLQDAPYQETACTTFLRKLFLHQAVLSAVITARVAPARIRPLPLASGYPFSQHERLPEEKQAASLDAISVAIFDRAWQQDAEWLERIPAGEPLRSWLAAVYGDYVAAAKGK